MLAKSLAVGSESAVDLARDLRKVAHDEIPAKALCEAGFQRTGTFAHSENWIGPGETPVQFTDDPALREALGRAIPLALDDVLLRILSVEDLLHAKLRAAADPSRRRSKRFQDLADAQGLLEMQPSLGSILSVEQRALLDAGVAT